MSQIVHIFFLTSYSVLVLERRRSQTISFLRPSVLLLLVLLKLTIDVLVVAAVLVYLCVLRGSHVVALSVHDLCLSLGLLGFQVLIVVVHVSTGF